MFTNIILVASTVAAFLVMPLLSFMKLQDATTGILASCSKIISLIITSIAWKGKNCTSKLQIYGHFLEWVLYVGSVCGFLDFFSSVVIRSMLSKCVTESELGKIFSLLASFEAIVPIVGAPLITFVYTNTLDSWLG